MVGLVTGVLLTFVFVLLHEYEHAREMAKRGFKIEEWGFGVPVTSWPRLRLPSLWPLPDTPFYLNIIPIMAYVKNSHRNSLKIQRLPYNESAVIYGSGIWGSIFYPLVVASVCEVAIGNYQYAAECLVGAVVLYSLKKNFCRWAVIPMGIFLLALLLRDLLLGHYTSERGYLTAAASVYGLHLTFPQGVMLGCFVSIVLGIMNTLPFFPFDGGHTMRALLQRLQVQHRWLEVYVDVSALIMFGLMAYNLAALVFHYLRWLFAK